MKAKVVKDVAEYVTRVTKNIPERMKAAERWLLWKELPGTKKPRKVPHYVSGKKRHGDLDSVEDVSCLATFEVAVDAYSCGKYKGIGFALGPVNPSSEKTEYWQGVDLDHLSEHVSLVAIKDQILGYVETSPSGDGVHAIGVGDKFSALASNESGIEAYSYGRFFTVTGNAIRGRPEDLSQFVARRLLPIHEAADKKKKERQEKERKAKAPVVQSRSKAKINANDNGSHSLESFFARVNAKALGKLSAWVPELLPRAYSYHDGYRIKSAQLGRDLEEDLSILPTGIKDFGEEKGKTPIDLVIDWSAVESAKEAALWLCGRIGVDAAELGWNGNGKRNGTRSHEDIPPPGDEDAPVELRDRGQRDHGRADRAKETPKRKQDESETGDTDNEYIDGKRVIIIGTDVVKTVNEAEAALLDLGDIIFQRSGMLVRVVKGAKSPDGISRSNESATICSISVDHLKERASQSADWRKGSKSEDKLVPALPPTWALKALLERKEWRFPYLECMVEIPTMRRDGSIIDKHGYDRRSGVYFMNGDTKFRKVSEQPSESEVKEAKGALLECLADFPFLDECDKSAAIAAVLTLLVRNAIDGPIPMFLFRSPVPGSGKSLLCDVISVIVTGRSAARMSQAKNEEEERKRLLAVAMAGDAVILIDNATGDLGNPVLDGAITSGFIQDRLLGKSEIVRVPWKALLLATGNNLGVKGDLGRRVIPVDLDPQCERPEERTGFSHDRLIEWVRSQRGELVCSGLTILKAYIEARSPDQGLSQYGSFEVWSDMVRSAMVWAGFSDPCGGRERLRFDGDTEVDVLRNALMAWQNVFGDEYQTLSVINHEIERRMKTNEMTEDWIQLRAALVSMDWKQEDKSLNLRSIGKTLRRYRGRVVGGFKFASGEKAMTGLQWRAERVVS